MISRIFVTTTNSGGSASGSLNASSAALSGVAVLGKTADGVLSSDISDLSGIANKTVLLNQSDIASSEAFVSGSVSSNVVSFGALVSSLSFVSGDLNISREVFGDISSTESQIQGTISRLIDAVGSLIPSSAEIVGFTSKGVIVNGDISSDQADIVGSSLVLLNNTANGSIQAQSPEVSGNSIKTVTTSGIALSQVASMTSLAFRVIDSFGNISTTLPTMQGISDVIGQAIASGALLAGESVVLGDSYKLLSSNGDLLTGIPVLSGSAFKVGKAIAAGAIGALESGLSGTIIIFGSESGITAYAINTENYAVSEYSGFNFLSIGKGAYGRLYAVKDDGLFVLGGDTDDGRAINSEILTGQVDMDADRLKVVPLVHADVNGNVNTLINVDGVTHEIDFSSGRSKPGRGLRGNKLSFGVRSIDGSKFTLNSMEPVIDILNKRSK